MSLTASVFLAILAALNVGMASSSFVKGSATNFQVASGVCSAVLLVICLIPILRVHLEDWRAAALSAIRGGGRQSR